MKIKTILTIIAVIFMLLLCGFITGWHSPIAQLVDVIPREAVTNLVLHATHTESQQPCDLIFYRNQMYVPITFVDEPSYGSFSINDREFEVFFVFGE